MFWHDRLLAGSIFCLCAYLPLASVAAEEVAQKSIENAELAEPAVNPPAKDVAGTNAESAAEATSKEATGEPKNPSDEQKPEAQKASTAPPAAAEVPGTAAAAPTGPDPVVVGVATWLGDKALVSKFNADDRDAAIEFYTDRTGSALWVDKAGFTSRGKALAAEIEKADDWGLKASDFSLPTLAGDAPAIDALVEAEARLSLEALKYARYARGGRINPSSLSRILDQTPPVKDPREVLGALASADAPDAILQGLHPKHEQFERLRLAMLKMRGPAEPEKPIDPALKIKIPSGKTFKVGSDHTDVALLRQRLKVETSQGGKETTFDVALETAIKAFQSDTGLKATGELNNATRAALNAEGEPKKRNDRDDIERIVLNMERWRWMPEDLGHIYVWNNIPEFYTRVVKKGEVVFKEKIIVGMPEWATPVFSAEMQFVTFNPSWGMPDGIKARELAPRLRQSGGGFFFFGNAGGDVIRAYGLNVYRGGQQINPDSVDWSKADLRAYSFIQPAGGKNPLGVVKFRFPNKYDVYMHDTTQRELFSQSRRAMSHGCIRVQNPKEFAAIMIAEGNGYSAERTASAISSGGEVSLTKRVPVHMTYFTVVVEENGEVNSFADLYGHDAKLSQALLGRAIRSEAPVVATLDEGDGATPAEGTTTAPAGNQKKRKKVQVAQPDTLADVISNVFSP